MGLRTNPAVAGFTQSEIRAMTRACMRVNGINLSQGICDLPTHSAVQDGAIEAIRAHRATYSPLEGIPELRRKIAAKMRDYNRLECDPESEVIVTCGATGAFAMAMLSLIAPGDEVVLFEPFYGYHRNTILALGGVPIHVPLRGTEFVLDPDDLERALRPRTKAIVVCTPSNPSGKVFRRDELETIARLCVDRNLAAVTDEIYEYIVYDGAVHLSLATLPEMRERTITISGFSKTFSITGWRLGYAVAPHDLARTIGVLNDLFYVCAPTPLQYGAAAGMEVGGDYYRDLARSYARKRETMAGAVRVARMLPIVPQGAYYMLADVSPLGWGDGREAARRLLAETGVATVPGSAFYHDGGGESLIRFCFAKEDAELEEASRRMARAGSGA